MLIRRLGQNIERKCQDIVLLTRLWNGTGCLVRQQQIISSNSNSNYQFRPFSPINELFSYLKWDTPSPLPLQLQYQFVSQVDSKIDRNINMDEDLQSTSPKEKLDSLVGSLWLAVQKSRVSDTVWSTIVDLSFFQLCCYQYLIYCLR